MFRCTHAFVNAAVAVAATVSPRRLLGFAPVIRTGTIWPIHAGSPAKFTMVLPLVRPDPFPQNSLLAARVTTAVADEAWAGDYCVEVFLHEFALGRSIADPAVIQSIVERFSSDAASILERAHTTAIKDRLREETACAQALGLFGAPTCVTPDGELFWGNDRIEAALAWAVKVA